MPTFLRLVFKWNVRGRWPWKWPWAMQSDTNLRDPSNSRKASNSRDVGNSKSLSSNRNASFKQGTPAGGGTTSKAKTPATAGSVRKSYTSSRKWSQKYGFECGSDKKIWWPWQFPKWPWFLLGVAAKACRDLAIDKCFKNALLSI